MPIGVLALAIAWLAIAVPAAAGTTWLGAQVHFPLPAHDVGDTQLGVDAGVTLTGMTNDYIGVGADVIYHYWPASPGYRAAFDHYLRSSRLETLTASDWAFSALQVTGHLMFMIPAGPRYAPWVRIGAGAYRLNRNLDEQRPAGTYAWVVGLGSGSISVAFGEYGGVGFDVHASRTVALGLDATFHHLESTGPRGAGVINSPDFSAFSAGAHVRFGWE